MDSFCRASRPRTSLGIAAHRASHGHRKGERMKTTTPRRSARNPGRHCRNSSHRFTTGFALATAAAATVGLCSDPAAGVTRTWLSSAGGTFNVAANWSGGAVPTSVDTAFFNLASAGYTVTFTNSPTNVRAQIGTDNVTFALGGNTYTLTAALQLGLISPDAGELTLTGGTLSSSGGSIGFAASTAGTASISTGATWSSPADDIAIGTSGAGTLLVRNGGDVICKGAILGSGAAATGLVSISGTGSTFTNTGTMLIGNQG